MAILLLGTGHATGAKLETESESVELAGAESVRVKIEMGAGELKVAGGSDELLSADFTYTIGACKPRIEYSVSGSRGFLIVEQPKVEWGFRRYRCEWDLYLNSSVPMDLSVDLGAGEGYLELGSLSLTELDVDMGVGDITVDLVGDWKNDLDASIDGGVGEITLLLPPDVGIRIDATRGIGAINAYGLKREGSAYVNDAYGESEVTLRINVDLGVGKVNLELGE